MTTATHVTPQVWVEEDEWAKKAYPRYPLSLWKDRGVLPLRSLTGIAKKYTIAAKYLEEWAGVAQRGYPGIAIDEFGGPNPAVNQAMLEALRKLHERLPSLYIAVWHAGPLTREYAKAFQESADIVLLETYARSTAGFAFRAGMKLARARALGIAGKCIVALGINDTRPRAGGVDIWAKDLATVRGQLEWLRENARDTAGVAFFAIYASETLMVEVDQYVRETFSMERSP